jgi:hypothetical protein
LGGGQNSSYGLRRSPHKSKSQVVYMVIHRSCYNKEDLEEALDRAYEGETFAAVARSSSVPLRTLFKKSKELQTTAEITELR